MPTKEFIEFWTRMAEKKTDESVSDADVQKNLAMWLLELACEQMDDNELDAAMCSALKALKHIRLSFISSQKSDITKQEHYIGTELCELWGDNPGYPYMLEADAFFNIGYVLLLKKDWCSAYLCLLHAERLCEVTNFVDYYDKKICGMDDNTTEFAGHYVSREERHENLIYQCVEKAMVTVEKNIDTTKLSSMAELLKWAEGFEVNYWEKYSEILDANGESENAENAKKHAEFLKKILFLENLK